MRWVVAVVVLLALSNIALAADEQSAQQQKEQPKWIQGENKHWPKWGAFKLRWLRHERREAIRDRDDAVRELRVVKSWGRTYVNNRVSELVTKTSHRVNECRHFKSLFQIRSANYDFHRGVHKRSKHSKPWHSKSKSKKHGKAYYYRKFSLHARMLIASRDRLAAAKRASQRCWGVVKKLRARRAGVEQAARSTAKSAVARAKAHVERTAAQLKDIDAKIARQLKRMQARLAKYKTYYFHRCRRVRGHKYKCLYSIRHGGGDHARKPFRFFKCLWESSNEVVVRHVCYK